ncbi:MAG TPA: oligogalacturonate lyase family protein [Planctomycetota bacterium]|nr:oligogalacturonate lyase family protein [Planctomycetota bacterium]
MPSTSRRRTKSESSISKDLATGLPVRRLTNFLSHSHHLYFTNPGWWDGGKRLVFASDRGNSTNLFSVELQSGAITQVSDVPPGVEFVYASVNPCKPECYFWLGRDLVALNLKTSKQRSLYHLPKNQTPNITNVTADGQHVCTVQMESPRFKTDLLNGYVGFAEVHAAKPRCQIVEVAVNGSGSRVLFEEKYWIGHINTSPTQPHLLSFCHEGPWERVDNRIWCLDRRTGSVWKVRPTKKNEQVGHEYWLQDGVTLGYHGHTRRGGKKHPFFGFIRYDNTEHEEAAFNTDSWHFFSNDKRLIVGDGVPNDPYLYLWQYRNGRFSKARILCKHRGSFHIQNLHPHPRFSPDGKYILFTADPDGYGNLYTIEVPPFGSLREKS